jgi:predicted ATPase
MTDNSRVKYQSIELDPGLLSTPFQVQTSWHVITGAPSCGKTTLIDQLAGEGFQTVPETAHEYLEKEKASGRTLQDIFKDRFELQRIFIEIQSNIEGKLESEEMIFLDRALPDSLTFNRLVGIDPNELLPDCFHNRYKSIYILDPLPYDKDGVRDEDAANVDFLDEWLERDYRSLGYQVLRVPVLPPPERLAYVLERF